MDAKTKAQLEQWIGKDLDINGDADQGGKLLEVTEDALICELDWDDGNGDTHGIKKIFSFAGINCIELSEEQLEKDLNPEGNEADECSVCTEPGKECKECNDLYCSDHMEDPAEHGCVPECYIDCGKSGDAVTLCAECENHYCKKHMKDPNEHDCATGEEPVDAEETLVSASSTAPEKVTSSADRKKIQVDRKENPWKNFPWGFALFMGLAIGIMLYLWL